MKRRVLEEYVEFLSPVRWPHALDLLASDCRGGSGDSTYYAPALYYINVCYPFVAGYERAERADPETVKPDPNSPNYPKDPAQQCFWDPFCAYADEHGTASQRMYNTLCIAYGGQPDWFKDMVDAGWLPPERAKNCAAEYQDVKLAFQKTILPFIDQEQMKKVQARSWFGGEELKER